jgi:polyphosphate kinase
MSVQPAVTVKDRFADQGQAAARTEPRTRDELFINRDLSLLEFNRRVLEEAQDRSVPLLERLKFVSIFSSNLDEFFMIRVSGLKERLGHDAELAPGETSTHELLAEIKSRVNQMVQDQMRCLTTDIVPRLAEEGIIITTYEQLSAHEKAEADEYFTRCVYPLLTPQAVDPTHPFPYIAGGSINLGLMVRPKLIRRVARALKGGEMFVRIKIPPFVDRGVKIGGADSTKFIPVEDLIIANIKRLVPDADPSSCHCFRITRDADIDLREAESEDLLETMEQNLKLRRFGDVVRLEVCGSMPRQLVDYLAKNLQITDDDIYAIDGPLDLTQLWTIYELDRPDLKDKPLKPFVPAVFESGRPIFDIIKEGDVLLHHPYNPYSVVTDFIKEAVEDDDVLAIKMCLYRIGKNSPIAPLLIQASENGKQVTVVVEIKARFDEENNIEWAKKLERAGVHVVYGILGLKTHCKTTLVVRREGEDLMRYVHLATGNYNPSTSAFYTDLGLLTCDDRIGADSTELFNYLTVYSRSERFKDLLVAPIYMRDRMLELIQREIENANQGLPARIIAKVNRLADVDIVNALYDASSAGVQVDLIVRGVCTLRPGVPGLSENIRVRSIVGGLLEHSRCYYFENGGLPEVYTGSADLMPRNLDRRVEVLTPVHDAELRRYLKEEFLDVYLQDNVKARILQPDGSYTRAERAAGSPAINSQLWFAEQNRGRGIRAVN